MTREQLEQGYLITGEIQRYEDSLRNLNDFIKEYNFESPETFHFSINHCDSISVPAEYVKHIALNMKGSIQKKIELLKEEFRAL